MIHKNYSFHFVLTAIFCPFYFQEYPTMVTDPQKNTARVEGTFRPDKVNVKQSIPSGQAIYYLSLPVSSYQSI
jgi:hypothetical protein